MCFGWSIEFEQARLAGDYLAERWADARIAILHDGTVYGRDLAEETGRQLNGRGVKVAQFGRSSPASRNTPRWLPCSRRRGSRCSSTAATPLKQP